MRVVAIDQGTTSTRGFVLDDTGAGEIVCTRKHLQLYPNPGWVEHNPNELLVHVRQCLEAAGTVDAIGIDNQGESCLAWDASTGEAISTVIVWQDRRTEATIKRLKADGAQELTMERAGLPLDPYFSASKLAWILEHNPTARELHAKGRLRLGTTDAFFIERLTGNFVTDITTASRTSLLNLKTGQWDNDLCDLFGIPIKTLPEIRPTIGEFGTVNLAGREVPISASAVDQQASLYGHGCYRPGDTKITFGTGAFALALTGDSLVRPSDQRLLLTVAWQRGDEAPFYALDGGVYCAGSALNWAKSLGLFASFDEINEFEAPSAISRDLVFVPALTGLGCPYWDGSAAGLWLGMSLDTTSKDLVQAILEGIAFRTSQVIDIMARQITIGNEISIDGGMSTNPYFCQFLANVLQKTIIVHSIAEQTAFGMAKMAMDCTNASDARPAYSQRYEPGAPDEEAKKKFASGMSRSQNWRC